MKGIIVLLLTAGLVLGAAATFDVKGGAGFTPTLDGDASEWTSDYLIGQITSDDNVYYRDGTGWTADDFQYELYGTWDADNVYFCCKVTADDDPMNSASAGAWSTDNMKINPGGQAASMYLTSDGRQVPNPSCPYTIGSTFQSSTNPTGNGSFPVYEFSISKTIIDPFGMGQFTFSPGSEENDAGGSDALYVCVGAEYLGNKQSDSDNPWDNPLYYPLFTMVTTSVESSTPVALTQGITASPNPFKPATTLSYHAKRNGAIKVYDLSGKVIKSFAIKSGSGKVSWNADGLASGIYIARMTSGKQVFNTRLFLTK
jgi:hypothetical protein